jgi:DNA-directed RNA polymerase subunit RPC12/RpoP
VAISVAGKHAEKPVSIRTTRTSYLRCVECGDLHAISVRRAKDWESRDYVCPNCRRLPRPAPDERDYAYWRERFTHAEIVELAHAIFT